MTGQEKHFTKSGALASFGQEDLFVICNSASIRVESLKGSYNTGQIQDLSSHNR